MAQAATVDAQTESGSDDGWLLLGIKGWIAYALVALINLSGVTAMSGPTQVVGYVLLCLVGAYVITLFWKAVFQAVGILH